MVKINYKKVIYKDGFVLEIPDDWIFNLDENDKLHGEFYSYNLGATYYYCRGYHNHGLMEGKWVWSHFNGVIGKVGNYINDKAEGLFHFYNKNGVIYAIDVYKMGKMVGFSKYFNYNGELVEDAFFSNDIFIFSRKYDKNGKSKGLLFKI